MTEHRHIKDELRNSDAQMEQCPVEGMWQLQVPLAFTCAITIRPAKASATWTTGAALPSGVQ